nr:acetylxylan esterase [Kibdelosporangium sp. MJ126-NF4]CEL20635.1 Acetyl xylan esterase [Kibdelosporangium sp. MJ126-NF4]
MREPEKAVITVPLPDDFDSFWAETLKSLPDPATSQTYVPELSTDKVAVYDVHYTSYDNVRVAAWYATPRTGGPFPALVNIPGYISEPLPPVQWAERGYAALAVAPRGKLRSNSHFNPGYPGLLTHNIVDHHTYGYRGFYVDVVRALDVLAERPEVDDGRIGLQGSSQGGGLGIVTAALRPDAVSCVAAGAPYLCGIWDAAKLTHSYPYEEINEYLRLHPGHGELIRQSVAYYDGMNFAPKVRAPMFVYIGLEDDVCPPETGYAVFNALDCPKELHTYPRCGHSAGLRWAMPKVAEFFDQHLFPEGSR